MEELEKLIEKYKAPKLENIPSFNGGAGRIFLRMILYVNMNICLT